MSKAKQTAGKTAKGAATRKGDAKTETGNRQGMIDYSSFVLPPPPEGVVLTLTVSRRKRKGGGASVVLANDPEPTPKNGKGYGWGNTATVKRSFFWLNADTLAQLDAVAKRGKASSRCGTLALIIRQATGEAVTVDPLDLEQNADRVGAAAETDKFDCAFAGFVGGDGWRKFRALGLKLKKDADALLEYLIGSAFYKPTKAA